jgi:GT2 family glycosyltransferase
MRTEQVVIDCSPTSVAGKRLDVSVIIVSFNTEGILRRCLEHLRIATQGMKFEVLVVDNNSSDGSADMLTKEFPDVRLIRSSRNLGFAAANNLAFQHACGDFLILLNSDAFVSEHGIRTALAHMQADTNIGAGGARLVGIDGCWQPSVRMFPSVLNAVLAFTGLAARYPRSRFFGRMDLTWADSTVPADADWVPGAFTIISRQALAKTGEFDESFFLYYEEVDLCRRLKKMGYRVRYFPDVVVVHLGGESSRSQDGLTMSTAGKQVALWRLRSEFLYYRKHHGRVVWVAMWVERLWHILRWLRNIPAGGSGRAKAQQSRSMIALINKAWSDTRGGRHAPPRPW